jgi:Cu(I)/Ag(I) efflux system periplasmic protein CusF
MRHLAMLSLAFCVLAGPAFAQTKGMDMTKDAKGTVHKATGVVTKVDNAKVTIKHEPVQSMNWPSMSMAFTVKDKALMNKIKNGQKIDFEFIREGRDYVVSAVK